MKKNHWWAALMHITVLISPVALYADSWLGIANLSSDHLRFASMSITIGTDQRDVLLRSLSANSARIWIRIPGDKPIYIAGIVGLGSLGLVRASPSDEGSAESLSPGVYQLDINEKDQLVVSPGSLGANAAQVVPLWGMTLVTMCDRLKLLDKPDIEKENKKIDRLIGAYKPTIIPGKYTSSPALMSLFSIGYECGWFASAIPEVQFERVDYLFIEPDMASISNKDEILPFHDPREIFKEAFKAGWDDAQDEMTNEQ